MCCMKDKRPRSQTKTDAIGGMGQRSKQTGVVQPGKAGEVETPTRLAALREAFAGLDRIRKRAKLLPKGMTIKDLIEEGRR